MGSRSTFTLLKKKYELNRSKVQELREAIEKSNVRLRNIINNQKAATEDENEGQTDNYNEHDGINENIPGMHNIVNDPAGSTNGRHSDGRQNVDEMEIEQF